jgi:ATP-binding cassette subfamily F protein uup
MILTLRNLTVAFGDRPVLEDAGLTVAKGDRIGLLGRNGEGKSTLLKVISGAIEPLHVQREALPSLKVALLDQAVPESLDGSVFNVVAAALGEQTARLQHYHDLLAAVALDPANTLLAESLQQQEDALTLHDDWNLEHRIARLLSQLELPPDAPFASLSGGMKRRALLGRTLVGEPDLLLLDEPTNHLDIPAITWLERFLLNLPCALIFVTHDRVFLQRIANSLLDLDRGKLTRWDCNYPTFLTRKADQLHAESVHWQAFDKKLAEEEIWIRKGIQARRTRNEGRVRSLQKLRVERAQRRDIRGNAAIGIQSANASGRKVMTLKALSFAYPKSTSIIHDFSTTIWRSDKIGLVGANGAGKTTLLQLLLGELQPTKGEIIHGTRLQIAYFDQQRAKLDDTLSVAENVSPHSDNVTIDGKPRHILSYLRDFLFTPETARAPIRKLSGGERARVLLARLFAQPANVLVMDEPTNDLDLETIELLEERILEFPGTVLLVSHDRAFLDNVVTHCYVLNGNGCVEERFGGTETWLPADKQEYSNKNSSAKAAKPTSSNTKKKTLSNKERAALQDLPKWIERKEAELELWMLNIANPAFLEQQNLTPAAAAKQLQNLEAAIAKAYSEWELLEKLANGRDI